MNSKSKKTLLISLTSLGIACFMAHIWMKHRTPSGRITRQTNSQQTAGQQKLSAAELDQLTAPIALYPDRLLSQILMAATWPAQVIQAVQWSHDNQGLQGDAAIQAAKDQTWDPSVKSLVAFPALLASIGSNPVWIQNLGLAFMNQPSELLDSVQRLRNMAYKEGILKSMPQQNVEVKPPSAKKPLLSSSYSAPSTITIESVEPDTVYIPEYDPREIYTDWISPDYPPVYFPPSDLNGDDTDQDEDSSGNNRHHRGLLAFGIGVVTAYAIYSYIHWDDNDHNARISIDANKVNVINGDLSKVSGNNIVDWKPETTHKINSGLPGVKSVSDLTRNKQHTVISSENDNAARQSVIKKLQQSSESETVGDNHLRQQVIQHLQSPSQTAAVQRSDTNQNAHTRKLQQHPKMAISLPADKPLKEDVKSVPPLELQGEQTDKTNRVKEAQQEAAKAQQEAEERLQAELQAREQAARQEAEKLKQEAEARQQAEQQRASLH
jgi:hypothetical protein